MDLFEHTVSFLRCSCTPNCSRGGQKSLLASVQPSRRLDQKRDKRFYVFFNEFRLETYVKREEGESVNDRNDRAVRRAVQVVWRAPRQATKAKKTPAVVMLSNDRDNLRKAKQEGLDACSLADYVSTAERWRQAPRYDPGSRRTRTSPRLGSPASTSIPEHHTLSKMMTGMKAGLLHQGIFNVSAYNYLEGSDQSPCLPQVPYHSGRENINRAVVDGDLVVIEVLPKDQWKEPSTTVIRRRCDYQERESRCRRRAQTWSRRRSARRFRMKLERAQGKTGEGHAEPTAKVVGIISATGANMSATLTRHP